jgi:two-component system sensor histidine kinase MtrB
VDPRRVDVILANLIGNALKHGGSPVRVQVRAEGPDLVVRVADGGPGIPEDVLPHVFDRFFKADAARRRSEGSGLGLSIAAENARIHGGTITAANGESGGAVFTLRLPLTPAVEAGHPLAADGGPKPGAGPAADSGAGKGQST